MAAVIATLIVISKHSFLCRLCARKIAKQELPFLFVSPGLGLWKFSVLCRIEEFTLIYPAEHLSLLSEAILIDLF